MGTTVCGVRATIFRYCQVICYRHMENGKKTEWRFECVGFTWTSRQPLIWRNQVVIADVLEETGFNGWIIAAQLEELKDLKG